MSGDQSPTVLRTKHLTVEFRLPGKRGQPATRLRAVDDVNIEVGDGETLGLVGESGSGKSTVARAVCGLQSHQGEVLLGGKSATGGGAKRRREIARFRQMIFQDPYSSLDPLMTVGDCVAEPLVVLDGGRPGKYRHRVLELLDDVRLPSTLADRLPGELSGGQRQRVAVARALATTPKLVICDEAVSALDASTQAEVIRLLERLRSEQGLAYLFIAHDLALVRHIADRVAVMYLGRVVESGPVEQVFQDPQHPYTRSLLSAAPIPHPRLQRQRQRVMAGGEPPDPTDLPSGCPFHPRCPKVEDQCRNVDPDVMVAGVRSASCHFADFSTSPVNGAPKQW